MTCAFETRSLRRCTLLPRSRWGRNPSPRGSVGHRPASCRGEVAFTKSVTPVRVDAINTFRVSAGRFASFRVLSRRQSQRFRRSARISVAGSIPGSSTEKGHREAALSSLRRRFHITRQHGSVRENSRSAPGLYVESPERTACGAGQDISGHRPRDLGAFQSGEHGSARCFSDLNTRHIKWALWRRSGWRY